MSKSDQNLTFYPAYCYPASPTYFIWVKLSCHDIHHHLRNSRQNKQHLQHQSSSGKPLYFYLNHPIQFIQVAGIIVAIEDFHPHIFLLTLDDSSGSTIDVIWRKPKPQDAAAAKLTAQTPSSNDEPPSLLPLLETLKIGTTLIAKGTLSSFRHTLQLTLLRASVITPAQELNHIASRTSFLLSSLSQPWSLSARAQARLLKQASGDREEENDRAVRARKRREIREKRERSDAEDIARQWRDEEGEREREAERAKENGLEVMKRSRSLNAKTAKG